MLLKYNKLNLLKTLHQKIRTSLINDYENKTYEVPMLR